MADEAADDVVVLKAYRQEKKVKIQLEADGPEEEYTIATMTGAEKAKWQNSNIPRVRYDAQGKPAGVNKFDGLESGFLSRVLYGPDGKPVPAVVIEGWPSPVLVALGRMAFKFNGLTEDSAEEKKA